VSAKAQKAICRQIDEIDHGSATRGRGAEQSEEGPEQKSWEGDREVRKGIAARGQGKNIRRSAGKSLIG